MEWISDVFYPYKSKPKYVSEVSNYYPNYWQNPDIARFYRQIGILRDENFWQVYFYVESGDKWLDF